MCSKFAVRCDLDKRTRDNPMSTYARPLYPVRTYYLRCDL